MHNNFNTIVTVVLIVQVLQITSLNIEWFGNGKCLF